MHPLQVESWAWQGLRELFFKRASNGWANAYDLQQVRLHFKKLGKPVHSGSWQCLLTVSVPAGQACPAPALDIALVVTGWYADVPLSVDKRGQRMVRVRWYMP